MTLKTLELINFRSYQNAVFEFSPQLNLITGPNGAGKTNLLEAIYVLGHTKSWRAADRELINHGADPPVFDSEAQSSRGWQLNGNFAKSKAQLKYELQPNGFQKRLLLNQQPTSIQTYLGNFKMVSFEPGSLDIILGPPASRRRWLNQLLSIASRHYLEALVNYRRVLAQRNALLRQRPGRPLHQISDQIFAWDVKLVELASELYKQRTRFIKNLNGQIERLYQLLANQRAELAITYLTSINGRDYATRLLSKLNIQIKRDLQLGFTTLGPHRDDVEISFNHKPANSVASRGEIRTLVLAIKLFEWEWLKSQSSPLPKGERPILLFDDIFSELDARRRESALDHLKDSQIFITTTDIKGLTTHLPKGHQLIKLA